MLQKSISCLHVLWLTLVFATEISLQDGCVMSVIKHGFAWYVKRVDCVVCPFVLVVKWYSVYIKVILPTDWYLDWGRAESAGCAAISGFKVRCWAITRSITSASRITLYSCHGNFPLTHFHRWGADWWSTRHDDVWRHTVSNL